LKLTDALPPRIRGKSHAATVYVALVAASVLFVVYGLLSAFTSDGDNWRNGISAVLLIAGLPCLVMARAIAIGRISTTLSIDRAALTGLLLLAVTNYQQLAVHPAAAESLTAQSCLMVVMAGLVLRSNVMQGLAWLGFLLPWLIVVALARPPHFSLGAWLSTWLIAFMLSAAASLITATERRRAWCARQCSDGRQYRRADRTCQPVGFRGAGSAGSRTGPPPPQRSVVRLRRCRWLQGRQRRTRSRHG
jgi:MFS family permease